MNRRILVSRPLPTTSPSSSTRPNSCHFTLFRCTPDLTPVFATLTQTPGVHSPNSHFGTACPSSLPTKLQKPAPLTLIPSITSQRPSSNPPSFNHFQMPPAVSVSSRQNLPSAASEGFYLIPDPSSLIPDLRSIASATSRCHNTFSFRKHMPNTRCLMTRSSREASSVRLG